GRGIGVLPHRSLTRELLADLVGVGQHRLGKQPGHVRRVITRRRPVLSDRTTGERRFDAWPGPQRPRTRRMQMLIEGDFGRLVALILGFYLCRLRHLSPSLLLQAEPTVFRSIARLPPS